MLLGSLTFLAPALLGGVAAAAIPIVIHLMLRPRPRPLRFPPVTFLSSALASGKRAQRVRDIWLLAARATSLVLIALLLAGPTCVQRTATNIASEPVAAAIVLDDSWSVRYRIDESSTILDRCVKIAEQVVGDSRKWPQPSSVGLYQADPTATPLDPTSDVGVIRAALESVQGAAPHAATLGRALRDAARGIAAARQPNRRVVILTDLAAHAWRDVPPGVLRGIENLSVRVVCPHVEPRSNLAIRSLTGPAGLQPENSPGSVSASLAAEGLSARASLRQRRANELVAKLGPFDVAAGGNMAMALLLPGLARGTYTMAVDVEPADRLPFDQTRYLAWQTGPRARVWLVTPGGSEGTADLSAEIYRNLLAPETLSAADQPLDFQWLDPSQIPQAVEKLGSERVDLVVMLPLLQLADGSRQALMKQVENGSALLLACASSDTSIDWPGMTRIFSSAIPSVERLDSARAFTWETSSPFAGERIGLEELTQAFVKRRLNLRDLSEGSLIHARFGDGAPAILSKRFGRGEIFLLATAPDPAWSELGIRAGGLLTWMHAMIGRTQATADRIINLTIGQPPISAVELPKGAKTAQLTAESGEAVEESLRIAEGRILDLPIRQPGTYVVRTADSGPPIRVAANWPTEESELSSISLDRMRELLGVDAVEITESLEAETQASQSRWLAAVRDPLTTIPFFLIAVLAIELWLSRRAGG